MADGEGFTIEPNSGVGGFQLFGNDNGGGSGDSSSGGSGGDASGDRTDAGVDGELGAISPSGTGDERDDFTFDPERHVGRDKRNADGSYRRKRGRRAGASNSGNAQTRRSKAGATTSVKGIENALVGIHAMLGAMLSAPELPLEPDESKPYAEAVAEVAKHYDIPHIADKTVAWMGLIFVMGRVYGPRAVLMRERIRAERAKNVTPTKEDNVIPATFKRGKEGEPSAFDIFGGRG